MRDTPAAVEAMYTHLLLARTGAERMAMAADMFDTAQMLMRASLASRVSPQDDVAMRMAMLERTYGDALSAETYRAVEARLRRKETHATRSHT